VLQRGKLLTDFCSLDFFGLARHDRVVRSIHQGIDHHHATSSSARSSSGSYSPHVELESGLARFFGTESALVFSSRNQAALSVLTAILNERDVLLAEDESSLPCADAAYLVNSDFQTFPRGDTKVLLDELQRASSRRRRIVVVESTSPLRGHVLTLSEILEVCRKTDAHLIVDESYSLGALGIRGAGSLDREGIVRNQSVVGTLASLGTLGGFSFGVFAATGLMIDLVGQRSRSLHSDCAPSPALACGALSAIELCETMHHQRVALLDTAARLERGISEVIGRPSALPLSPIVTVPCSRVTEALDLAEALFQRGILVDALQLKGPLSQRGAVRFVVSSALSESDISKTIQSLSDIYRRVISESHLSK
jgi:glycine C-acetyltransferase